MITVGISELKASLRRLLDRVQRGEEILVINRGRPVARLVPIDASNHSRNAYLEMLERNGVIRRGAEELPADFWSRPRPRDPAGSVRQALIDERDER